MPSPAALILAAAAATASTDSAAGLSADEVKAALEAGAAAKKVRPVELKKGRVTCFATTPALRVQLAAHNAKKQYKTVAADALPPEMLAPVVEIACPSIKTHESRNEIASVNALVILPKGGGEAIQPLSTDALTETYSNAYGATWEGAGMVARFAPEAFATGAELRVVFSKKVYYSNIAMPKDDLGIEIKLKD